MRMMESNNLGGGIDKNEGTNAIPSRFVGMVS
jgi:hypothetical protein